MMIIRSKSLEDKDEIMRRRSRGHEDDENRNGDGKKYVYDWEEPNLGGLT